MVIIRLTFDFDLSHASDLALRKSSSMVCIRSKRGTYESIAAAVADFISSSVIRSQRTYTSSIHVLNAHLATTWLLSLTVNNLGKKYTKEPE